MVLKPLRLWPGIILIFVQWLFRFGLIAIIPEEVMLGIMGELFTALAILVWWAFFSRASLFERWGGIALILISLAVTQQVVHESMKLMPFITYIIPVLCLAFVLWAAFGYRLSVMPRRVTMVITVIGACGIWAFVRTSGVTGEFQSQFTWRWAETAEERLIEETGNEPEMFTAIPVLTDTDAVWPGFRGPDRDGIVHDIKIETNWSVSPPVELWRRLIGPGWSSFAVKGALLYTQEQRGDEELVSCYNLGTGEPVWRHSNAVRFWESNSGAGPRGTPTLGDSLVYTVGATGILNVLHARDGSVKWVRNIGIDTNTKVPTWGISSSPLLLDDVVIVAAAGSLIAYDLATGQPRWFTTAGGDCYSSPHLATIDGVRQVLLLNDAGASAVAPSDGTLLWEHPWEGHPIVQPTLISGSDLLISVDETNGIRRINITRDFDKWNVSERWTSARIKPYFNDSVIHKGFAFGFDGRSLACVDIKDGERRWKGGRYGRGQILLLTDQDLLLILSEKGSLALVQAVPDQFTEIAQFQAIKGKTWNHPVLVNDILVVRNGREMAAFRLKRTDS